MQITLTYDGNTIDLQSGAYKVSDGYAPSSIQSGDVATDRFDIWITGTTGADASAKLQALEMFFEYARLHKTDVFPAFLNVAMDSGGILFRSRVTDGLVSLRNKLINDYAQKKIIAQVTVERAPWWEDTTERQISLTNDNGTDNTSGLKIYNCSDGAPASPVKRVNYFEVAASKVSGDLPAPVRMVVSNVSTSMLDDKIMISQNVMSNPASFTHIYEGEAAGGSTADSSCSGGNYSSIAGSNLDFMFDLTSQLQNFKGGSYHIIGRIRSGADAWTIRPYFRSTEFSLPVYGQITRYSKTNFNIVDFGIINIPDIYIPNGTYTAPRFGIQATRVSGSGNFQVDFLQVSPVDGWRTLYFLSYASRTGTGFVLDEIQNLSYMTLAGNPMVPGQLTGAPLKVWPNKLQRFYVLRNDLNIDTAPITHSATVQLYYRPRRRTI